MLWPAMPKGNIDKYNRPQKTHDVLNSTLTRDSCLNPQITTVCTVRNCYVDTTSPSFASANSRFSEHKVNSLN